MKPEIKRIIVLLMLMLAVATLAQTSSHAGSGEEPQRYIEVRRRQLELQSSRRQFEQVEKLAAQGLVAQNELERLRHAVAVASINYQQALLTLLDIQPRISVRSAVKMQEQSGRQFVNLVICNLTAAIDESQFKSLYNLEGSDPLPEAVHNRTINDVFVSLRGGADAGVNDPKAARVTGAIVSLPYEAHIPQLKYGEMKKLSFQLLTDVDSVTVAITCRNQTQEIPVQLERAAADSETRISSSQLSQETNLGSQAMYNLTLERPTVDIRSFHLKLLNLPRQISYSFIDPQTQARLSQITFPAGVTRLPMGLKLFMPERADDDVQVDKQLEFWALALNEAAAARFGQERPYTEDEIAAAGPGRIKMSVIPRGVGQLVVMAPSLLTEIESGQVVESTLTVRNTGTRRLDNIRLSAESPLNWRVEMTPSVIPYIESNREEVVKLRIVPTENIMVGDYEVRIKTECLTENRRAQADDKVYRVNVKAGTSLATTAGLMGGVLLLVIGVSVCGVKMTKR